MPRVLQGFILLLGLIFCVNAFAQNTSSSTTTKLSEQTEDVKKNIVDVSFSMSSSVESEVDEITGPAYSNLYIAGLTYNLDAGHSLSLNSRFGHTITPIEEFDIDRLSLGFRSKTFELNNNLSAAPGISVFFPVNPDAVKDQSYLGSLNASVVLTTELAGLAITYVPVARVNNHQFTNSADNTYNARFAALHDLTIDIPIVSEARLSLNAVNTTLWNYNNRSETKTAFSQEISYQVNKNIELGIGHSNLSSRLSQNGRDSNFDFFNQSSSEFYASLSIKN